MKNIKSKKKLISFKSLKMQIFIPFLLIIIMSGFSIGFISYKYSVSVTTNKLMENVAEQAKVFNDFGSSDIDTTVVDQILSTMRVGETGSYRVLSVDGQVYFDQNKELIGKNVAKEEYFQKIVSSGTEQGSFIYKENGEEKAIGFYNSQLGPEKMVGLIVIGSVNLSEIEKEAQVILQPILISIVIAILVSALISIFISSRITNPIRQLQTKMKLVEDGDLSIELANHKENEIGQLSASVNNMKNSIRELIEKITTVTLTVTNKSGDLKRATIEMKNGSEQIATTMEVLATGTETQAKHTNHLSNTMEQFTQEVTEANTIGENIYNLSQSVLMKSERGSDLMKSSVNQMDNIEKIVKSSVDKVRKLAHQSQEISKLVLVIKNIAEQTNLLALNAAIEAARAGEHGNGFAVVADEVKKLAEQVSFSVSDITNIVENIQAETKEVTDSLESGYCEVERGALQIRTTGETFGEIESSLTNMEETIKSVSKTFKNISEKSKEMKDGVEEIASISEQSAAGVEQTSANAQESYSSMEEVANSSAVLSKLAEELNQTIIRFKLK